MNSLRRIGVVGPCGAGKSTLITHLKRLGIEARHIAQEHSFVPDMWRRVAKADLLIFLDVSYEQSMLRRPMNWTWEEYKRCLERLAHAREHADLYIHTDQLTADQVFEQVKMFLE